MAFFMSFISPQVAQQAEADSERFANAAPFRHIIIDGFLESAFCQRILDDFPNFQDRYAINEMGEVGGKAVRTTVREISPAYRALDAFLQTSEFLDYVSKVTGIPDLLYDTDYVGGGTHENRHGQKLDPHVDFNYHPKTKTHRRLNLIVYLNHRWEESWGGALELHSDPWNQDANRRVCVLPLFNRAVIFETNEISWHGFSTIHLPDEGRETSRKSFAIYLYTRERPAVETAAPHATVYVPDAMPTDWQAGRVLSAEDLDLLKQRFSGLRGQLRYLYQREKRDSAQLDVLERALAEARDSWRLPLEGYVVQPDAANGIWHDRWVGPEFSVRLVPQQSARSLEIELWAPDGLDDNLVLAISLGGQRWEHHVARGKRSTFQLKAKWSVGAVIDLRVSADRYFVPAEAGSSSDDRKLSWMLRGIRFFH